MSSMSASAESMEVSSTQYSPYLPWLVCFSAALFFFYEFIQLNMFNAISIDLMKAFSISPSHLGYLSATYLMGDVVFLFPAGLILDRLSIKKVIITAMSICILGTLVFAITHNFYIAALAHFAAGIGNAFSLLSCIALASRWFPPRKMALVTGLIVTFAMVGGMVAQTPLTLLCQAVGWRHAILYDVLLGIIIVFCIFMAVKDFPPGHEEVEKQRKQTLADIGFFPSVRMALSNLQNWFAGIYTSLLNLPIMVMGAVWGMMHLEQTHQLTAEQASFVTTMIFLGTTIGSPIIGLISDKIALRKTPMIICAIISIFIFLIIMLSPNLSYTSLLVLYFLLGLITSSQVLAYPLVAESNPKYLTSSAMGLTSLLIMGGGAIAQPLFGWLLQVSGDSHIISNVPMFTHADFTRALAMMPIAFVIGLIAAFLLKETHCKMIK